MLKKRKKLKRKKKQKTKIKKYILIFIFITLILATTFFGIKIILWILNNKQVENELENINEITNIKNVEDTDNTQTIENDQNESDPYWYYIKMNLIDVDFTELKKLNSEVKGWIQVSGTNINYPYVQSTDNNYYLTHSFNKNYNEAGWVFLDYRNQTTIEDKNTIIYAHSRLDKTMFGSLNNILTNNWLENIDNHIVKISTETENTLWQVFSIYHIKTTTDYMQIYFKNDEEFTNFTDMLLKRSIYNFNTTISPNDKILTLSTCYNDNEKLVLHAKLIKYELK